MNKSNGMAIWQVDLLGTPRARRGTESVALRSRHTWALLASLLMEPETVNREVLAARFWPNAPQDRKSLGMCLVSLRKAFGSGCFITDRDTVRVRRAAFETDWERVESLRDAARAASDPYERRVGLRAAAALLRGRFIEGADTLECGDAFLRVWGARCDTLGADTLLELARNEEEGNEPDVAYETLGRALRRSPENGGVARSLWRSAQETGREKQARRLLAELGAEDLLTAPHPKQSAPAAARPPLPAALSHVLESLAIFAGAFPPDLARGLDADATPDVLAALAAAGRLHREETGDGGAWFVVPVPERETIRVRLSGERLHSLGRAYFRVIRRRLVAAHDELRPYTINERGAALARYEPHFVAVLADMLRKKPTAGRLEVIGILYSFGFAVLAASSRDWMERAAGDDTLPDTLRDNAKWMAGQFAYDRLDFAAAAVWFGRRTVGVTLPGDLEAQVAQLNALAMACHHAADYAGADLYARESLRLAEMLGQGLTLARSLYVFAEVIYSTGFPREALVASARHVSILRRHDDRLDLATGLYQHGVILHHAGERDAAIRAANDAIALYHAVGDHGGIADCLRLLATLRCELGAFGEAFVFAVQAREIYERLGVSASVAAMDEVFGDLHRAQGDHYAARKRYAASLSHWESVRHPRWITRLRKRLASVSAHSENSAA